MKQKNTLFFILIVFTFFLSCSRKEKKTNLIQLLDSKKYALSSKEDKVLFLDSISKTIDDMPKDLYEAMHPKWKDVGNSYFNNDI